jgi:hypothetical protein
MILHCPAFSGALLRIAEGPKYDLGSSLQVERSFRWGVVTLRLQGQVIARRFHFLGTRYQRIIREGILIQQHTFCGHFIKHDPFKDRRKVRECGSHVIYLEASGLLPNVAAPGLVGTRRKEIL